MDDHDPPRARSERDVMPIRGPAFFREGEAVMFRFVIDTANIVGPRPASRLDRETHAEAWAAFSASEPPAAEAPPKAVTPSRRRGADR